MIDRMSFARDLARTCSCPHLCQYQNMKKRGMGVLCDQSVFSYNSCTQFSFLSNTFSFTFIEFVSILDYRTFPFLLYFI